MKFRSAFCWLALLLGSPIVFDSSAAPVSRASAQPSSTGAPSDVSVTVGGRTVFTSGFTKWSTGAQSGGPNILSELTWRGVDAVVPEVNAEVVWKRLVLLGAFGGGFVRDGVLNDDDFLGNDRQGRFSHTRSSVGGDGLFYGSVDLGFRAFSWTATGGLPGYVDAFAGFQYWQENYDAFLDALVRAPALDWSRVEMFHLDEYIGLPADHPASFRRYLLERLIRPTGIASFHLIDGSADPTEVCRGLARELNTAPIDVAFVGIGENGHLAFNDPPADFEADESYLAKRPGSDLDDDYQAVWQQRDRDG